MKLQLSLPDLQWKVILGLQERTESSQPSSWMSHASKKTLGHKSVITSIKIREQNVISEETYKSASFYWERQETNKVKFR